MFEKYDVIVVGAGHAGCEAAAAAANMNKKVLLATMNMNTIAQMSCNPAIGGVAKGQLVREIDALGGFTGIIADKTTIQFRMLNRSKGPAMWSPRSQNDRMEFAKEWRILLESNPNIDFWQEMVTELIVENQKVIGIKTSLGLSIYSKTVILTNGTFLNGIIHIGKKQFSGGRSGERASKGITEQLIELGFESGRMKTGTPPRIDGRTIDYSKLEEQKGDENPAHFSYFPQFQTKKKQLSCYIAYTNENSHDVLRSAFDLSPMFTGTITGTGPRYCPSIEDKISRFSDRNRHQLFVEPEGWSTVEIYLNGFSSSLPEDVQYEALRKIVGFENAKMFRPGYAIEYDYFPPQQLKLTLETKLYENLFFAGQINGTTGYEEAGAQGLIAGINAALKIDEQEPFILQRDEAYIGVLIDDLINKGTDEPYRMFTSRAEYRILLRQDNADLRLTKKAYELGIASKERYQRTVNKKEEIAAVEEIINKTSISPEEINEYLGALKTSPLKQKNKAKNILTRPKVTLNDLIENSQFLKEKLSSFDEESLENAEIKIKYSGYIKKESELVKKMQRLETLKIPININYHEINALSSEAKEKLTKIRPINLGQASRISGVSPADISVLMIYLGR